MNFQYGTEMDHYDLYVDCSTAAGCMQILGVCIAGNESWFASNHH